MTKMFGNLTDDGLESTGDVLGGGGTVESGAYAGTIKAAYAGKSQSSNAQSINVIIDHNGREIRDTFWITNRDGENFYKDKNDATKKRPLPGYTAADDLCMLTTEIPLAEQEVEDKVLKLYNFDEKKEVPTNVPVLTALTGKPVLAGVLKEIVDKNVKQGEQYVPSGETREQNVIDKFFHPELKVTMTEAREGVSDPIFYEKWVEKNTGKTRNKAKGVQGNSGAPGRPSAGGGGAGGQKTPSLFGPK